MGWLYRWSSLLRGYDLSLGYNRVIVLLSVVAGALGLALTVPSEASIAAVLGRAAVAGLNAFGAAALAKEIDPDHPRSAVLAAAVAIPAAWIAMSESLPALLWLLLLLRFINRATGLPPRWSDTLGLLLLAGWLMWPGGPLLPGLRFATPLFGVLTGAGFIADALLPDGRRAHGILGGLVLAGAVAYWIANAARFAMTRVYEGRGLVGERYLLTNISTQNMVLAEQEFDRETGGVLAVAIENHNLRPGDSTTVFVIRQGG